MGNQDYFLNGKLEAEKPQILLVLQPGFICHGSYYGNFAQSAIEDIENLEQITTPTTITIPLRDEFFPDPENIRNRLEKYLENNPYIEVEYYNGTHMSCLREKHFNKIPLKNEYSI